MVNKTTIADFTRNLSEQLKTINISIDVSNGVFVWTEILGYGHVFLSIHKENYVTIFTYGRYDDTFMEVFGEGVLIKYTGSNAIRYMTEFINNKNGKVYKILDSDKEKVLSFLDYRWQSSDEYPNKIHIDSVIEYGRVIDTYSVFAQNCTTTTLEAIRLSGSKLLIRENSLFSYEDAFIIPKSLQGYLDEESNKRKNVFNVTNRILEKLREFK